jgi:hypothetical protein
MQTIVLLVLLAAPFVVLAAVIMALVMIIGRQTRAK